MKIEINKKEIIDLLGSQLQFKYETPSEIGFAVKDNFRSTAIMILEQIYTNDWEYKTQEQSSFRDPVIIIQKDCENSE